MVPADEPPPLFGVVDLPGRDASTAFVKQLFAQLNAGRRARLAEEVPLLL